ncbi:NAD(P)H-dependent oxidoreductase [Glaesserella parasuis]|uniref:FMN dependent NADH:quinone oxidoreductase n=3 Tax=Glaesserella parasuis TaxID=738 RepID=B8F577_GLAP5|nr:NAD(P)H-dependent oxidoreductase [Glaesserella parasuis]AGO15603.1 azoreductase/NAD(P)H dehydrogenase (quinone) [Glaesserella parasuis ZJ0906]ACL32479.1 azoreductase/NAD(P)H dehydrogenase (quinone) [Glaesserella parasuis SH0165]AIK16484.1 FMN-dependent NADH-azoreductase [Glaesserella parasuis]AIK90880.1 FMN-dependent NADH-azoreductase [Glaesserella parasuis]ATW44848.1 FMN-dependent NADH-azoreductase [Glaesserella parasuis str. Nagasaki]
MKNILVIKSSILADKSKSNQLVDHFKSQISANIIEHNLGENPLPYYDINAVLDIRGKSQDDTQYNALTLSNNLINEVNQCDLIVFAVPMYNLGIPAQLKTYLDYLTRMGVTFRYTENGHEGLIKGKKAIVVLTHGGVYRDTPTDLAKMYMHAVLNFIGIFDIEFVYAEGLGYGAEISDKALEAAKVELDRIAQTF